MSNNVKGADTIEIVILRVFLGETEVEQEAFSKDTIILGRDPYVDVCLEDPMVSRVHASIQRHDCVLIFTDHSSNGTIVNEKVVAKAVLQHGDTITVGRFRILVGIHSEIRLRDERISRSRGPDSAEDQTLRGPLPGQR